MRILVFSDTHGKIDKAAEIYHQLKDIDLVVHLGDLWTDSMRLKELLPVSLLAVKGNMDGAYSREEYRILETEFGKIYLAHGHMENVKQGLDTILYKAESLGCKAVFFGHTHIPLFRQVDGLYLLNPGSLSLPAGGRKGSYAVVTVMEDELDASILYEEAPQTPKKESGFLKNLLNNSDRF